jgi:hypothetical protein
MLFSSKLLRKSNKRTYRMQKYKIEHTNVTCDDPYHFMMIRIVTSYIGSLQTRCWRSWCHGRKRFLLLCCQSPRRGPPKRWRFLPKSLWKYPCDVRTPLVVYECSRLVSESTKLEKSLTRRTKSEYSVVGYLSSIVELIFYPDYPTRPAWSL